MAGTFYKYAERDADSQINWAEVGKGLSDMLAETNRVREEKKDALDAAQRETMKYLSETPNGEDATARKTALEYADQASNRMRIAKQLMEQGQMSPKEYTIFRQNLTDNTNLLFNANKAYQEEYARKMQRNRDGVSSYLEVDRMKDAEMFGNWNDTGFFIGADGTVMAGKMIEKEVDGKKVRTLDQTPGNLRNIDAINQLILGDIDKYKYEEKVDSFVDALGKDEVTKIALGTYSRQGIGTTIEDITKREYILPGDKPVLLKFIQAENDKIKEITGTDIQKASILVDSKIIAPNGQPYTLTNDPKEAAKGENFILKEYDPNTRGVVYKISDTQSKDAEEFIRANMRVKYNRVTKEEAISQPQLQESIETIEKVKRKYAPKSEDKNKESDNATSMIGKLFYGDDNEVKSSIDYFKGMKGKDGKVLFTDIVRDGKTGVTVTLADGSKENISFIDANGRPRTQEDFIASAGPLLANQLDVSSSLNRGSYRKGAKFNSESKGRGTTIQKFKTNPNIISDSSQRAVNNIQSALPEGFIATDTGGTMGNTVEIVSPNNKKYIIKTKIFGEKAIDAIIGLEDFVNANIEGSTTSGAPKGKSVNLNASKRKGKK